MMLREAAHVNTVARGTAAELRHPTISPALFIELAISSYDRIYLLYIQLRFIKFDCSSVSVQ